MSKAPAPAPAKPNSFLQTMLFMMLIVTGFNLFNQINRPPAPPQTDLMTALRKQNRDLLDVSAAHTFQEYNRSLDQQLNTARGKLDEEVKAKKLTQAEADLKKKELETDLTAQKVRALILVADTQLKAGISKGWSDRVRDAYHTLGNANRQYAENPVWNEKFPVTDVSGDGRYGWREWSGRELYTKVTTVLGDMNRKELVWGLIPGFQLLDFLVHMTGGNPNYSYAIAAFCLALLVRGSIFKLATQQIMSARRSSQLMPMLTELKKEFGNDQVAYQTKMMELYKEYGINPFAAIWPAFVQMPLFLAIYQCMVHYQFEFDKGHFLWINPQTSAQSHGFIAPNLGQQDTILIIVYAITMLISQFLMPVSVTDPTQARQQRLIGIGMTGIFVVFMFSGAFPVVSGFVLYWIFTNVLATAQSLVLYRRPLPPLEKVNTAHGGVVPPQGRWGKFMEQMQKAQEEEMRRRGQTPPGGSGGDKPTSKGQTFIGTGETKTGTPAKHKPKKRN